MHTIVICVHNLIPLCLFLFSSTVIGCWQQLTAVDSWWQLIWKKNYWNFKYTLKLVLAPNSSSLAWFSFSSVVNCIFSFSSDVISCHQLLTAVDSQWQLIWKKFDWNLYVYTKVDTCAEFQLSSLIFIFISCQQLI